MKKNLLEWERKKKKEMRKELEEIEMDHKILFQKKSSIFTPKEGQKLKELEGCKNISWKSRKQLETEDKSNIVRGRR